MCSLPAHGTTAHDRTAHVAGASTRGSYCVHGCSRRQLRPIGPQQSCVFSRRDCVHPCPPRWLVTGVACQWSWSGWASVRWLGSAIGPSSCRSLRSQLDHPPLQRCHPLPACGALGTTECARVPRPAAGGATRTDVSAGGGGDTPHVPRTVLAWQPCTYHELVTVHVQRFE